MTRALVFDLDGTLLDEHGSVSDVTASALEDAGREGHRLAVATARPLRLAFAALGDVAALFDVLIVSNGAATMIGPDFTQGTEVLMDDHAIATTVETARRLWPDCGFGWESGDAFFHDAAFERIAADRPIVRYLENASRPGPGGRPHQVVVATTSPAVGADVARFVGAVDGRVAVTDSSGGVIEVSSLSADKASAMLRWLTDLGLEPADAIAFGDGRNDIELLRAAGRSVAMGNAGPPVRAAATDVTGTNVEHGVATFLREHVLG